MMDRRSWLLLLVSVLVRLPFGIGAEWSCHDSWAVWANSRDLELILSPHGETSVWSRNPGMTLWAHLTWPVFGITQAILGGLTCVLLERRHRWAGWVLALWLPHVVATGLWLKWVVAGFGVVVAWDLWHRRWWSPVLTVPVLVLGFWTFVGQNVARDGNGVLWRVAGFWMPITELGGVGGWWFYPSALLWLCMVLVLVRTMDWRGATVVFVLSALAASTFGVAQQRLPFEPVLIGLALDGMRRAGLFEGRVEEFTEGRRGAYGAFARRYDNPGAPPP